MSRHNLAGAFDPAAASPKQEKIEVRSRISKRKCFIFYTPFRDINPVGILLRDLRETIWETEQVVKHNQPQNVGSYSEAPFSVNYGLMPAIHE
jgi:hypothetical protein